MKILRRIKKTTTLDDLMKDMNFSKKDIHLLKMEKRIIVNGNTTLQSLDLEKGDVVEINPIKDEEINVKPVITNLNILYEDDVCLVVDKPVGVIIHDDGTDEITLDNYVAGYYKKTGQKHPVYHIHRLDKDTSGCVLYCKQSFLVSYFDACLAQKKVSRIYLAITQGKIDKAMTINKKIGKDRHINNKFRVSDTGKDAITHIEPVQQFTNNTLVKCILDTGRTHQIRVHLASIGHPIVGDELYGGGRYKRMLLHASKLKFTHPVSLEEIEVTSKIIWNK